MSYRHEKVFLQSGGLYRVGSLPDGWRRMKVKARAITFYNDAFKSSITTDAFCGKGFPDRPLDSLTGELVAVLSNRTTVSSDKMMLNDRGALRTFVTGTMDGVDVDMDVVVVKKDTCAFDFVAVMPHGSSADVQMDFENFFMGFEY